MPRHLFLSAAALSLLLQAPGVERPAAAPFQDAAGVVVPAGAEARPAAVVAHALRAVEGDSAAVLRARGERRLRRDPADGEAALGLATLGRLLYRYDEALARYRALAVTVEGGRPRPIAEYAAHARLGLATVAQARGERAAAAREFAATAALARAVGDGALEVEARLGVARARTRLEGPTAALALLDSIGPTVPAGDLRLRAMYDALRGGVLAQLGRPEATAYSDRCLAAARQAGARRVEASCHLARVIDAERRGNTRPAIDLLDRVAELNAATHDRWALATTRQWQGYLLSTRGEYGRARATLHETIDHARASQNLSVLAWAHLDLAIISRFMQDRAAAAAQVAQSSALFARQRDRWGAIRARELEVTLAADAGDYARARRLSAQQLDWARQMGRPRLEFGALLAHAALAERERDWPAALALLDTAETLMERNAMEGWVDQLWYRQGRIALRQGDLARAEDRFRQTLTMLDPAQQVFRYRTRARLAEVLARRGDLVRAERALSSAGEELDDWRRTLTDDELRVAAFQLGEEIDRDLGVPQVIATLAVGGQLRSAFAAAERRRARALADRIARERGHTAAPVVPDAMRGAGALRNDPVMGLASATAVAKALPDEETALLEYVTGDDGAPTTLLVIWRERGRPRMHATLLPPAAMLAPRIARFGALLEEGSTPRALARDLGTLLLDPALQYLGPQIRRLIVVPDGPVHHVPFGALRLADGRYVVEQFAVSGAPSAAIAMSLWQRGAGRAAAAAGAAAEPLRLLAFGDPSFDGALATGWRPLRGGPPDGVGLTTVADRADPFDPLAAVMPLDSIGRLPRLAQSGREARLVAGYAPEAVVRLGDEASASYLKHAALERYRVIHFATHALVDDRSAARTALALSAGEGESGLVGPGDLAALRLQADLVVLSACRTAGGVVMNGEGVQGLTAPLIQAGARSVVATHWRIDDGRTVALVRDFYDALARGRPVVDALREAKLAALRRGAPPGEWAAFSVVGDPFVTLPLREPPPPRAPWWWLAGAAGATLAVGGGIVARRRGAAAPVPR